jgi:ribulose kinase
MQLYADATGCRLVEHVVDDSVLLGTAVAAASAAGLFGSLNEASSAMRQPTRERLPDPRAKTPLDRDYRVFLEMHRQRRELDELR